VALAALIHASFQLGVSVLTLLSGHSLSKKFSNARTLRLTTSFVAGAGVMTLLLFSAFALFLDYISTKQNNTLMWSIISGLLLGVGIAVWLFYYRREPGTSIWIPRGLASFLASRTKTTRRAAEAFSLGVTSVLAELPFLVAPLAVAAYALDHVTTEWQVVGLLGYVVVSLSTLVVIWMLVSGGHKLSEIQKWRETHKSFLQYTAGAGLIILGAFTFVNEALSVTGGTL
jgi:hypothetical protein